MARYTLPFRDLRRADVGRVGGKNASLGEMIAFLAKAEVAVPDGFAVTAEAYRWFVGHNYVDKTLGDALTQRADGRISLAEAGRRIRAAFLEGEWPKEIADEIAARYAAMRTPDAAADVSVAVRSSATAEDLPQASFAGQQESFLNVHGAASLLDHCRRCYASLYTDRAIAYREANGFEHEKVALSVGVQRMVRADTGGAGVMFTIDPDSGWDRVVRIDAAWGLGETVVQGQVDPDAYQVFKPFLDREGTVPIIERTRGAKGMKAVYGPNGAGIRTVPTSLQERGSFVLSDAEVMQLAGWAATIEDHYGCPMDIEWARDGADGPLFVVQARPETVRSREEAGLLRRYAVTGGGQPICRGVAIGHAAAAGSVCLLEDASQIEDFRDGAVLVTGSTDPDWVPIMKRAAAVVTDHGGRTSHAAIVSRELGVPAIVGTSDATFRLHDGQAVTVSCVEGDEGLVLDGEARIEATELHTDDLPATRTKVMLNLANPATAGRWWRLPIDGVGLVRMEFVIANAVRAHPLALLRPEAAFADERRALDELIGEDGDGASYFVETLSRGLARIAALAWPHPAVVRMSDFKSNEYAGLLGGAAFEPEEENPMIGLRGASRYLSDLYRDAFRLECRAVKRLREEIGFENVGVMIPFCRTPSEADGVLALMKEEGLRRGEGGLEVSVMCELPSNVLLAEAFAERFDAFSIGSNDLTQLTLGVDRDSDLLAHLFDERDPAVQALIAQAIEGAHRGGATVGLCGQGPSDHPEIARFLVAHGIDSVSVTPDGFVAVKRQVAAAEEALSASGS